MDGDGDPDLVTAISAEVSQGISVLLNESVAPAERDLDRDGRIDSCEGAPFHRGDIDDDGRLLITDAVGVLFFLFRGGEAPDCAEAADADNDGRVSVSDAVALLSFLFLQGSPPAPPGPPGEPCGEDPDVPGTAGDLGCERYESCDAGGAG